MNEQTVRWWDEPDSGIVFGGSDDPLRLARILESSRSLRPLIDRTALIPSSHFSCQSNLDVYFKPENIQITGSYKIRGASFRVANLSEEERKHPLITASAGNHAQGVAHAAMTCGLQAIIVMPDTTPLVKVNRTKALGAQVILSGESFDEACCLAQQLAAENNYTFIHPFDDLTVAAGQGSVAFEILEELPDVAAILVPIGGGGLAAGVASYIKQAQPGIKVLGVEPVGAASARTALEQKLRWFCRYGYDC